MDATQVIIIINLVLVTGIIVACGLSLISLLKELKTTLIKTNTILDDTKLITNSVAKPVSSFSEFVMGFRSGLKLFDSVFKKKNKESN